MKAALSSSLLLALVACAAPGDPAGLGALLQTPDADRVQVAALVVDLDSGETLLSRNARMLLRPASTMKVLTTASVCRRAPDGFVETVLGSSALPDGDVALIGGGDPFLTSDDVRALTTQLHEMGLHRAKTITVVDPLADAERFGEGWMWDDEPSTFMPAMSAAAIDGGCVTVRASRTPDGAHVELLPVAGALVAEWAPGDGPLRATRGRYRTPDRVVVTGDLGEDGEPVERALTVPDPARFTSAVLADALVAVDAAAAATPVATTSTTTAELPHRVLLRRPLDEVVTRTNKVSDNLGAEMLLRLLGAMDGGPLDERCLARGLARVDEDIAALGLDPRGYRIADGSGVSHYTLVSAELLVATLVDMHRRGGRTFEVFEQSLPIAGVDGTLARRMRDTAAAERVRAKTGTISGVSNLAGYVTTASGRRLAFAVLTQNFVGSARDWRALQDALCAALAAL